jgi:predicted Zn-dependent protease with MMP-like domain
MVFRNSIQQTRADIVSQISGDNWLIIVALFLALVFGLLWWWNRRAKKWLEETDRVEALPSRRDWQVGDRQQKPGTTLKYSEQEFQEMVANALDEVPEEFAKEWNNVAVIVSTGWATDADKKRMGVPEGHLVFGIYSGVDRTKGHQADSGFGHVIAVYQPALESVYGSDKDRLKQEIRRVVLHELAHHLGMSHHRMKEIGL